MMPAGSCNNMARYEGSATTQHLDEHRTVTTAGWSYRTNDRGWMIYRDPQTGRWHTQEEALSIVRSAMSVEARPRLAS
jgi:hypothetical protein